MGLFDALITTNSVEYEQAVNIAIELNKHTKKCDVVLTRFVMASPVWSCQAIVAQVVSTDIALLHEVLITQQGT